MYVLDTLEQSFRLVNTASLKENHVLAFDIPDLNYKTNFICM